MKLVKKPLCLGQSVICKTAGGIKYRGKVTSILNDSAIIEREHHEDGWEVRRNNTGSWDGMWYREETGWYSSRVKNIRSGAYLYSEAIDNWKQEFG